MKRIAVLLGIFACIVSCATEETDALKQRVDNLESTVIASINQQIININSSIRHLESADTEIRGYISTLQTTSGELKAKIESNDKKIDALKTELQADIKATADKAAADLTASEQKVQADIQSAREELLAELESLQSALQNKLDAISDEIKDLQDEDKALDKKISDLKSYTDGEIKNAKDWVSATFATLEQFNETSQAITGIRSDIEAINKTVDGLSDRIEETEKKIDALEKEIPVIKQSIADLETRVGKKIDDDIAAAVASLEKKISDSSSSITEGYTKAISDATKAIEEAYTKAISDAIAASESSVKEWINNKLTGYWTIAEVQSKLEAEVLALQKEIEDGDNAVVSQLDKMKQDILGVIDAQKKEITSGYEKAISDAITTNNGIIDGKIAQEVATLNGRIDTEVKAIRDRIDGIEERLGNLEGIVSELVGRIQSLAYIPRYTDGASTMWWKSKDNAIIASDTLDFRISPASCLDELLEVWPAAVKAEAIPVQTRAGYEDAVDLPVLSAWGKDGILSVELDGSNLGNGFFSNQQPMSCVILISDGNNERSSEYIKMIPKKVEKTYHLTINNVETKASVSVFPDHNELTWNTGDLFYIGDGSINLCGEVDMVYDGRQTASFTTDVILAPHVACAYPYDAIDFDYQNGGGRLCIPSVQSGKLSDCIYLYGESSGTDIPMDLQNAILRISIDTDEELSELAISADEDSDRLFGPLKEFFQCDIPESDKANVITIPCFGSGDYYIALRPGTYSNLTCSFTTTDGKIATKTLKSLTISRGSINIVGINWEFVLCEYVDLGLSVKWATRNVCENGFVSSPEEYGDYYAWGETAPKSDYSWINYKFRTSGDSYNNVKFSKYNTQDFHGPIDYKTLLDPEDDVANVILGNNWRIPTISEWDELTNQCTWTWTDDYNGTGVTGEVVTGPNGNSIFLPATSSRYDTKINSTIHSGFYWSSDLNGLYPDVVQIIYFSYIYDPEYGWGNYKTSSFPMDRCDGLSVRPVYGDFVHVTGVSLSSFSLQLANDERSQLTATVAPSNASSSDVKWYSSDTSVATVDHNGLVTAVAPGIATITVETVDGGFTDSCEVTVSDPSLNQEAVDLGLPSGLKWAPFNLGASKPEEYGNYYAWGETAPKSDYSWSTYKFGSVSSGFSKYNFYYDWGTVDNQAELLLEDDVANVILGNNWRIPTIAEWDELKNKCTWNWTDDYNGTGVTGQIVTGPNGNSIFLPAAGWWDGTNYNRIISTCYYWSSSLNTYDPEVASCFYVYRMYEEGYGWGDHITSNMVQERFLGLSIRPVYGDFIPITGISITSSSVRLYIGGSHWLAESLSPATASNKSVKWYSSDTSVATVDHNGLVTAVAPGTATITAETVDGGITDSCEVTVSDPSLNQEVVDLGLPSGLKWASFNLGASAPEGQGNLYAWGETITKDVYSWSTYKFRTIGSTGECVSISKYYCTPKYTYMDPTNGSEDNNTELDPEDDVANAILGNHWRMPTEEEWDELINRCNLTRTDDYNGTGVKGSIFTGPNGNSIFLPDVSYWSSSLNTEDPGLAVGFHYDHQQFEVGWYGGFLRCGGCSVRPVFAE